MFYCEDCDSYFEETKMVLYTDAEIWHQSHIQVCPYCHSEYLQAAERCARCEEYKPTEKLDEGLCEECLSKLRSEALAFIEKYNEKEQEKILEFLNDI